MDNFFPGMDVMIKITPLVLTIVSGIFSILAMIGCLSASFSTNLVELFTSTSDSIRVGPFAICAHFRGAPTSCAISMTPYSILTRGGTLSITEFLPLLKGDTTIDPRFFLFALELQNLFIRIFATLLFVQLFIVNMVFLWCNYRVDSAALPHLLRKMWRNLSRQKFQALFFMASLLVTLIALSNALATGAVLLLLDGGDDGMRLEAGGMYQTVLLTAFCCGFLATAGWGMGMASGVRWYERDEEEGVEGLKLA